MNKLRYFKRYFAAGSPYDARWQALQQKAQQNGFRIPSLSLTFQAAQSLALDSQTSYPIAIAITRDADDPLTQPCIIHWHPIEHGSSRLYRPAGKIPPPKNSIQSDPCFRQLYPGGSVSWELTFRSVYFDFFQEGEFYKILWVGWRIFLWDWGTLAQHSGGTLGPNHYAVVIPGDSQHLLGIEYVESDLDEPGPLQPSPAPILASARMSGAAVFSLSVAGPATLSMGDPHGRLRYPVTVTVWYDVPPEGFDGKPVTFHTFIFRDIDSRQDGFRLHFRKKDEDDWSPHELGRMWTWHRFQFSKTVPVNVGRNEQNEFAALFPGDSRSCTREVTEFPKDVASGDEFRYKFKKAQRDWWDWKHFRDHENTVVGIDRRVWDPRDNGGRPGLVVPASNSVEFNG